MYRIKAFVLTTLAVAAMGLFGGCSFGWTTNYVYENGEKYVPGDREITENIETIDIDYMSGNVTLEEGANNAITVKETSKTELDDKRKVHTWVDGSTLYVRYCASAKKLELNRLEKELTISLPADTDLDKLKIHVASGNVDATFNAANVEIHTASGNVTLEQKGRCDDLEIHTASGNVQILLEDAGDVDVAVSSGNISLEADKVEDLKTHSASGNTGFTLHTVPATSDLTTSAGNITVYLPETCDLTADLTTAAGDIRYEQAFSKKGNIFTCGNGENHMTAHTAAGDIVFKTIE